MSYGRVETNQTFTTELWSAGALEVGPVQGSKLKGLAVLDYLNPTMMNDYYTLIMYDNHSLW